jgi:hypothetical protein
MKHLMLVVLVAVIPSCAASQSRGLYVETGFQAGTAFGLESWSFSQWRAVSELGYMVEGRLREDGTGWGGGATFYAGLGSEDLLLGLKPRARYRFNSQWFVDVSAGMIVLSAESEPGVSQTGFIGGIHLGHGRWWTLRTDVNVRKIALSEWSEENWEVIEQGYETGVYVGLALREKAGWIATGVGVAAVLGLMVAFISSGVS